MKRLLVVLLALGTVLGLIRFGLLNDANIVRFTLNWLGDKMARELVVNGEYSVEWGNPIRLKARSVTLSNPAWADNPLMAKTEFVEAAIDLTTIPGDSPLIISELIIRDLTGELVSNEAGQANWEFGPEDSDGSTNFLIQELEVTNSRLEIRRPDFNPVEFEIANLRQEENAEGLLQTYLTGKYNDRAVDASGLVGPFSNLLNGENVRLALSASIGTLQVDGSGMIDDLENPRQPKLKIDISAPDAMEVGNMFGIAVNTPSDIELTLAIEPEDAGVRFRAAGRWGPTNLNFQGRARDLPNLDGIELSAMGDGNDLRGALRLFGFPNAPERPFKFSGDLSRDGERLDARELELSVGRFKLQFNGNMNRFPSFNDANLQLSAKGPNVEAFRAALGIPGVAEGDFNLEAELERSESGKDEFRIWARTELGRGTLKGTLGSAPGYVGTKASFRADGVSLGKLSEFFLLTELKDQPFLVTGDVDVVPLGFQLQNGVFKSGDTSIEANGLFTDDPRFAGTELTWSVRNLDLAEIGRLADVGRASDTPIDLPSRPITASGKTEVRPDDLVLKDLKGTIGMSEFSANGQLGRAADFRGTDMRILFRGPRLERLTDLFVDWDLPEGPFQLSGRVQRTAKGIRLSDSLVDIVGTEGKVNIELALPAEPLDLTFDIEVAGPDLSELWEGRYNVKFGAQPFTVDLRGAINQDVLQLDDGLLEVGETELQATGVIRRGEDDSMLQIRGKSPEIAEVATVFGVELFPGRKLDLAGTLRRRGERFRLENFLAKTNKGDLAGTIDFLPGDPPRIDGALTSKMLDISWVTDPVEDEFAEEQAEEKTDQGDGRLIPDWELPLDDLKRVNVDLSITADEVLRERRDVRNAYIEIAVQDGGLSIAPYRFGGDSGSLDAELHLIPNDAGAEVKIRLMATDLVTGLFQPDGEDLTMMPKADWEIDVTSQGRTTRELAATLNGTGQLNGKSGRLSNQGRQNALFGDLLSNIVSAVNPFAEEEPYTEITCAVFPFTFNDGVMETAPSVVVQTDKLNILSRGEIDLKNERIDMSFDSKPRGGLGVSAGSIVNPFVRIGGTMADPTVALDRTGAVITGGAAFFTAGLSLLAKAAFDAAWRSPDPCGRVLEEADKRFAKKNGTN